MTDKTQGRLEELKQIMAAAHDMFLYLARGENVPQRLIDRYEKLSNGQDAAALWTEFMELTNRRTEQ